MYKIASVYSSKRNLVINKVSRINKWSSLLEDSKMDFKIFWSLLKYSIHLKNEYAVKSSVWILHTTHIYIYIYIYVCVYIYIYIYIYICVYRLFQKGCYNLFKKLYFLLFEAVKTVVIDIPVRKDSFIRNFRDKQIKYFKIPLRTWASLNTFWSSTFPFSSNEILPTLICRLHLCKIYKKKKNLTYKNDLHLKNRMLEWDLPLM